jgi:hypothetical protein
MTIKRTISRAFVTATVPVAMIMGGASPALAGDDEKNHNDWVCHEFNGDWSDHDDWEKWKDEHCDDDDDNGHHGKKADHNNNDHGDDDHNNNDHGDDDHNNNDHGDDHQKKD